jgi:hypothetical protein
MLTKIACECTTQQPSKAMETTRVAMTRTAKARVKARSRVCDCADCSCCHCSSWESCAQDVLSGHHPHRISIVAQRLMTTIILGQKEPRSKWRGEGSRARQ